MLYYIKCIFYIYIKKKLLMNINKIKNINFYFSRSLKINNNKKKKEYLI